jgi:hypothetical protein
MAGTADLVAKLESKELNEVRLLEEIRQRDRVIEE